MTATSDAAASPRWHAFLRGLVTDVLVRLEAPDGSAARANDLVATLDLRSDAWARRYTDHEIEARALGCVLFAAANELGVAPTGWRHERRAYEYLVRAVLERRAPKSDRRRAVRGIDPRELPDLAAGSVGGRRAEHRAVELAFWLERHLLLGARRFAVATHRGGHVLRCDRGGDGCCELGDRPRASTRRGAWIRIARIAADEGDQQRPGVRRRLRP